MDQRPSLQQPLETTLVLVGMMGAGKSTIGRRLARRIGVPFMDVDEVIELEQGCKISTIFEQAGEDSFRKIERETIQRLLSKKPMVLATGGGAFIQDDARDIIQSNAISILLDAPLPILLERVSKRNTRPLLETGDKETILQELLAERMPIYQQAHFRIPSDGSNHWVVVDRVIEALNRRQTSSGE